MPLYGNQDVNTGDRNYVSIPSRCIVYMFRVDKWAHVDLNGWNLVSTGSYLIHHPGTKIYKKSYDAGSYVLDNFSALYLFDLGKCYYM